MWHKGSRLVCVKFFASVLVICFLNTAAAQQFGISAQIGGLSTPAFNAKIVLDGSTEIMDGLVLGGRICLTSAPLAEAFSIRINPFLTYRAVVYSDGLFWVSAYGSAQLNTFVTPVAVAQNNAQAHEIEFEPGDDDVSGRAPLPIPLDPVAFGLLGIVGADAAYFIDQQSALYFGLEIDGAVPSFVNITPQLSVFPYLEFDYNLSREMLLSAGGYLSWSSYKTNPFGYLAHVCFGYALNSQNTIQTEIGFDGLLFANIKYSFKF